MKFMLLKTLSSIFQFVIKKEVKRSKKHSTHFSSLIENIISQSKLIYKSDQEMLSKNFSSRNALAFKVDSALPILYCLTFLLGTGGALLL